MSNRIPITVVTGFLGAGKTTLLRHLLTNSTERLAIMVNEFGSVGLDGDLIKSCGFCSEGEMDGRIIELNNGCLCCTVQDDFLPTIEKLLLNSDQLDGIVIETSGLALPQPLLQAIEWPQIRSKVFVNGVVTVVDSQALASGSPVGDIKAFEKQRKEDENLDHLTPIDDLFSDQLSCADIVLFSRADLVDSQSIELIKQKISLELKEGTSIIPVEFGHVDSSLILGIRNDLDKYSLSDDHDHDHDHVHVISSYVRVEVNIGEPEIREILLGLVDEYQILRLKGRFWQPSKQLPLQLQMVGARINTWYEKAPENVWKPKACGLEFVVLSLKEGVKEQIYSILSNRVS